MTTGEFQAWAALHCEHTGADEQAAAVITANMDTILNRWHATYGELCECTTRMIEAGLNPRFANEHTNTIKAQLDIVRAERAVREQTLANLTGPSGTVAGCDCPKCIPPNGSEKYQRVRSKFEAWLQLRRDLAGGVFKEVPRR